jgi:2-keto-4-pentenoate hydratase
MELTGAEQQLQGIILQARTDKTTLEGKNGSREVDLDGAYRIQSASQRNRALKGYKFGLISPAKQQQMGVSTPVYGRIYADMLYQNTIPLNRFIQPRLEPEIAVVLRDPVAPVAHAGAVAQAIGGYFLGVDILDSVWQGYKFTAPEVVADNTSGGGFLLAGRLSTSMPGGTLRMYLNGELFTEGPIAELGNPVQRLQWLAGRVGGLDAGMIIFFGSPAASVPAQIGALEVVDSEGDTLTARLTA